MNLTAFMDPIAFYPDEERWELLVASPSTMSNDRGRKLAFFQTVPSLRTILIVYRDEARIEAWQRSGNDWAPVILKDASAVLPVPEFGGELRLAEIYQGLGPLA